MNHPYSQSYLKIDSQPMPKDLVDDKDLDDAQVIMTQFIEIYIYIYIYIYICIRGLNELRSEQIRKAWIVYCWQIVFFDVLLYLVWFDGFNDLK